MTTQQLTLALVNKNTLSEPVNLDGAAPFRTRAVPGGRYLLAQGDKGTGPQTLTAKRIGNNLELSLPGEDHPRLIIEDFYLQKGEVGGLAEDGSYHAYINAAENDARDVSELHGDESAFLMMSPDSGHIGTLALPDGAGVNFLKAAGAFAALLALGGIIYTFHHNHSGTDAPLVVPVITSASTEDSALLNGDSTNNPTPAIAGNGGTAGNFITLYDNDALLGSTVVDENGNWTFTPPALPHGIHVFTAAQSNSSGKVSARSALFELNIDLLPPDVTLDSVADAVAGGVVGAIGNDGTGLTNDTQPRLSGTAEAGSLVIIYDGTTAIGSVVADATTGVWSWQYQGVNAFTDGAHTLSVTATDAVGNVSAHTDGFVITVDTVIAQPTLNSVTDAVAGGIVGAISPDGTGLTNDAQPLLSGKAEAGSVVTIYDGATAIGSAQADAVTGGWSWQFVGSEHFAEGQHVLTVRAVDPAGNTSIQSDSFTITVDTIIAQPTLDSVTDAVVGGVVGAISHDGTGLTNDAQPRLSGKAEAGSVVTIYDGATAIGSVVANATTGVWSWQYSGAEKFAEGQHALTVRAVDIAGNASVLSSPFVITVDTTIAQPTLDSVTDAVAGGFVGAIDKDGTGLTNDAQPRLSGKAEAGSLVTIYDGTTAIGSVVANASTGVWSWQYSGTQKFAEGQHVLTVDAIDPAGNLSVLSDSFTITVDTTIAQPTLDSVTDAVAGGVVGAISHDGTGLTNDAQPRLSGAAEAGSLVTIYDGTTAIGSVVADATTGVWSWQYAGSEHFAEGQHALTVRAVDIAGNASVLSDRFVITVDTTIAQPTLDSVTDAVAGGIVGAIGNDGTGLTNDAKPVLSGKAEAGSLVTIYDGTTAIGSVVANATTGVWSWQYSGVEKFAEGQHVLTVKAVDIAGNISTTSDSFSITVDTTPPGGASITAGIDHVGALTETIFQNRVTDDTTPEFYGTADPSAWVYLYDNGQFLGSFQADATGKWSWILPELNPGQHNLSISTSDAAGNMTVTPGVYPFQVGDVWDFNDGTYQGWTILGAHAQAGSTFTQKTPDGGSQLEFITPSGTANYSGNVMSIQIDVEAGKAYDFSFILSRITSFALINPAQLALTVDGVPVSRYYTVTDTPQKVEGTWIATTTGKITLAIHDLVATGSGNDFWIDDIAIAPHELAGPVMPSASSFMEPDAVLAYTEEQPVDTVAEQPQPLEISLNSVLIHEESPLFNEGEKGELPDNAGKEPIVSLLDIQPEGMAGENWAAASASADNGGVEPALFDPAGINAPLMEPGRDDNLM